MTAFKGGHGPKSVNRSTIGQPPAYWAREGKGQTLQEKREDSGGRPKRLKQGLSQGGLSVSGRVLPANAGPHKTNSNLPG
jgi:hypothetical protein